MVQRASEGKCVEALSLVIPCSRHNSTNREAARNSVVLPCLAPPPSSSTPGYPTKVSNSPCRCRAPKRFRNTPELVPTSSARTREMATRAQPCALSLSRLVIASLTIAPMMHRTSNRNAGGSRRFAIAASFFSLSQRPWINCRPGGVIAPHVRSI